MAVIWNTSCKKCIFETSNQCCCFFFFWFYFVLFLFFVCFLFCFYISFQDMQSFFEFIVSAINHINGLHLFWGSFEWFCLQINSDAKYFFLSCSRHCDQRLIVVIVYYFQTWNKKRTRLSLVELLAVTWVPCILRHPILMGCIYFETVLIDIVSK